MTPTDTDAGIGLVVIHSHRFEDMEAVARWVAVETPFDRLYYYGPDRPIHVSYGPDHSREFVDMIESRSGRLVPRV
jgi:hypothetical protein